VIRFVPENGVKAELEDVARKNAAILISEGLMKPGKAFMEEFQPQFKSK
jgi:hypothetical protein